MNLGQYEKFPWDKFEKKKRVFCLVDFFRIVNVNQCFFTLNILCNEVDKGLGHEKKHFVRYHLNSYGWLKLMTHSYTCREQILHRKLWLCVKKVIRSKE